MLVCRMDFELGLMLVLQRGFQLGPQLEIWLEPMLVCRKDFHLGP